MKFYRKILSIIILITFLVPATGIYFIRHSCSHCNINEIIFSDLSECYTTKDIDYNCCDSNVKPWVALKNRTSYNQENIRSNINSVCCINESHYLKDYSQYTAPGIELIKIPVSEPSFLFNGSKSHFPGILDKHFRFKYPPGLSSDEILIRTGKLLV